MGESTKAVCALLLIVGTIVGVIAWTGDRPDAATWAFRIGGPTVALLALGLILKLHSRADLAHDYLRDVAGNYFNRDGFCFALAATAVDGIAYMDAYFQNQRDKRCLGRIAMRPARGFWMTRPDFESITYEIACAPAAFGVARIAVPIPQQLQGKRQVFEVGASVDYPDGKGERLRFHDGVFLRADAKFGDDFRMALNLTSAALGAAGGSIVFTNPASAKVDLPEGVAENVPENLAPEVATLWQLGDAPLEKTDEAGPV